MIKNRRTVREFLDKPLEISIVYEIIDAARYAPSSGNLQNWFFVVVNEQKEKTKLANLCLNQLWMARAPVMVMVCVKADKCLKYYGPKLGRKYSLQNGNFAASNILMAAEALNISAAFVGAFSESDIKKHFRLPDDVEVIGVISLGYSKEKPKLPTRYELRTIVFLNKWGNRIKDYKYQALGRTSDYVEDGINAISKSSKSGFDKLKDYFSKKLNKKNDSIPNQENNINN